MKRQVAITGPTPEFLRWSIRQLCPLRADTDLASVDQTEKRLRAIRAAGTARQAESVYEGIACRRIDGQWKGFRIEEVFGLWDGEAVVQEMCGSCPANVGPADVPLAGCHGWLRPIDDQPWSRHIEDTLHESLRLNIEQHFLPTRPVWYGLWARGELNSRQLSILHQVFSCLDKSDVGRYEEVTALCRAIDVCLAHGQLLDVELIPAGHSDGLTWTIQPHCDRCKAAFGTEQSGCRVCGKAGRGHPEIKRKVLGLRPWVDLSQVIGSDCSAFIQRHHLAD